MILIFLQLLDSHDNYEVNIRRRVLQHVSTQLRGSSSIFMDLFFLTTKEGLIFQEHTWAFTWDMGQGTSNEENGTHNSWRMERLLRRLRCTLQFHGEIEQITKIVQIWLKPTSEYIIRFQKYGFWFSPLLAEKSPFPQNRSQRLSAKLLGSISKNLWPAMEKR